MRTYVEAASMLPQHMREGIVEYIRVGRPVGDFLTALLSNDLMAAFERADDYNTQAMREWASYLYSYAPRYPVPCYGSLEIVENWKRVGGLEGLEGLIRRQQEAEEKKGEQEC